MEISTKNIKEVYGSGDYGVNNILARDFGNVPPTAAELVLLKAEVPRLRSEIETYKSQGRDKQKVRKDADRHNTDIIKTITEKQADYAKSYKLLPFTLRVNKDEEVRNEGKQKGTLQDIRDYIAWFESYKVQQNAAANNPSYTQQMRNIIAVNISLRDQYLASLIALRSAPTGNYIPTTAQIIELANLRSQSEELARNVSTMDQELDKIRDNIKFNTMQLSGITQTLRQFDPKSVGFFNIINLPEAAEGKFIKEGKRTTFNPTSSYSPTSSAKPPKPKTTEQVSEPDGFAGDPVPIKPKSKFKTMMEGEVFGRPKKYVYPIIAGGVLATGYVIYHFFFKSK